jgi:hypothetical protein
MPPCMGTKKAIILSRSSLVETLATIPSKRNRSLTELFASCSKAVRSHVTSSQWSVIIAAHSIPVANIVNTNVPNKKNTLGWTLQFHPDSSSVELGICGMFQQWKNMKYTSGSKKTTSLSNRVTVRGIGFSHGL